MFIKISVRVSFAIVLQTINFLFKLVNICNKKVLILRIIHVIIRDWDAVSLDLMSLCWAGVSHRSRPVWVLRCHWWAGSVVLGLGEGCSADGCKTNPSVTGTGTAAETQDSSVRITHYTHLWIDMSFKTQINRIHPITRISPTEQDPVNVLFIPIFLI